MIWAAWTPETVSLAEDGAEPAALAARPGAGSRRAGARSRSRSYARRPVAVAGPGRVYPQEP